MGPWDRELITVSVRGASAARVDVRATRAHQSTYPEGSTDSGALGHATLAVSDLVPWLVSVAPQPGARAFVRIHVAALGDPGLRPAILGQPWEKALSGALVTCGRGQAPQRPRLVLPLQLSTTRSESILLDRLDDFVKTEAERGWTLRAQGHIVHAFAGDRLDNAVGPRTRLVILETDRLGDGPTGGFNVLQIAAAPAACTAFSRRLYRAIFHDAPLDAAVREALDAASLPATAICFDLFDGDEQCLRPRKALLEAVDTVNAAMKYSHAKPPESGLESFPKSGNDLLDAFNDLSGAAKDLDFGHEAHGVNQSVTTFDAVSDALDAADAARAEAGDIEPDRSAQLWLEDDHKTVIPPEAQLAVGGSYQIKFQIATELRSAATTARLSNETLRDLFKAKPVLKLQVRLYADPAMLELSSHLLEVSLERWGASEIVGSACKPLKQGSHQVRACLYYRGNLIESLALRIGVGQPGQPGRIDFTGIETFGGLSSVPQIGCALWINDVEGVHWIGVHDSAVQPLVDLGPGDLRLAGAAVLDEVVPPVRAALGILEGIGGAYRFTAHEEPTQAALDRRDQLMCELARVGREMFQRIVQGPNALDSTYLAALAARLKASDQVLSIARLDGESSIPWAAMYDFPIAPGEPNLTACKRYLRTDQVSKRPFAESPGSCREQKDCPLRAVQTARTTVCPFGFWGFRHQIELRLRPKDGGVTPIDRTRIAAGEQPRAAAAMYAFDESAEHLKELGAYLKPDPVEALAARATVLDALRAGDRSLYYFFCHAKQDKSLNLVLASSELVESGAIAARYEAADDGWDLDAWDATRPLVSLNACKSIALDAAMISPFLDRFVGLGASALIGTEIEVYTELAADVATELVERMVTHHESLGMALLVVRRRMLGAGNPMGLVYSAYGSAALHFHTATCACEG